LGGSSLLSICSDVDRQNDFTACVATGCGRINVA
jgi:hypothetical protein